MENKILIKELRLYEGHFLDQLNYKLEAIFGLMDLLDVNKKEIRSFMDMMRELSEENIKLLDEHLTKENDR